MCSTAEEVGRLLTLVAPGYFAQASYNARYPRTERGELPTLVISAALSLPIVALAGAIASGNPEPLDLDYVALLLGLAIVLGYVFALLRGRSLTREVLGKIGYRREPEALGAVACVRVAAAQAPRDGDLQGRTQGVRLAPALDWRSRSAEARRPLSGLPVVVDPVQKKWLPRQKTDGVVVNVDEVLAIDVRPSPQ